MAAKNNNKMNISYTIKAVDRFTKTHAKLERQLSKLNDMTQGLSDDKSMDVDADTKKADAKLSLTKRLIKSIPGHKTIILSAKGFNKGLGQADQFATKLRTMEEMSQGLARGLLGMMIPTIGASLGVAAGGAGAFAAGLLSAGAAVGGFAMVAVPTISYLKELDATVKRGSDAWYKLSSATRGALTELDLLRSSWSKLQDKFREPVLEIFALNMQGARKALELFTPTIESSVNAVRNLSEAFNKNLMSDDVKAIFEWLGNTAGPYLEKYTKAIGNFIVGFMNMMVAFDPLAKDFADGFLNMSERFREWSSTLDNNKAFQDFLAYTRENGPLLLSFLGNLIRFLVDLGIAMAPVGEQILELTNKFLKWSSGMLENHEWIGKLIAGFIVFKGILGVALPIISMATIAFNTLWPIISVVFGWITKLGGVIRFILPWITRIGVWVLRLGGPLGWLISTIIFLAGVVYANWDSIWKWTKDTFSKVSGFIEESWGKVEATWSVLSELAKILWNKFEEMVGTVEEKMTAVGNTIETLWGVAQSFLEGIDLWSIGADIIRGLVNGISSVDVWSAVTNVGSSIKNAFTSFFKVNSPSKLMRQDVGRWITLGVVDGMVGMKSKAEREAERVANAIKKPFDSMDNDYTFGATGVASNRSRYQSAKYGSYANSSTQQDAQTSTPTNGAGQYAVFNIGGYEAKGFIEYVTTTQEREKGRKDQFRR
jgi:hypothetical protein